MRFFLPCLAGLWLVGCVQGHLLPLDPDTGLTCAEGQPRTWFIDGDGDGFGDPASAIWGCEQPSGTIGDGTDCDDTLATVYPGAPEICDGEDNDCDDWTDDEDRDRVGGGTWCADTDGDGFGDPEVTVLRCQGQGLFVADCGDCDDGDTDVSPDALEVCNSADDDCDGLVDGQDPDLSDGLTWWADADGDGYSGAGESVYRCSQPSGYSLAVTDCDDDDPSVHPDAPEICDAQDNDCDDLVDGQDPDLSDGTTWCRDADRDGFGDPAVSVVRCSQPSGYIDDCSDCDDTDAGGTGCPPSADDGAICAGLMGSDDGLVPTWTGACDSSLGFTAYGDHCYFAVATHTTWPDARASCRAAGGYLATPTDTSENAFLQTLNSRPYLGACDGDVEGTWTWITGEPWSYTNWATGEPNDTTTGEDCLEIGGSGTLWNDIWCDRYSYGAGYVCEFEIPSSGGTGTAAP
ncbi:MAG: MopE-related protein [Pseudomonadota bacterium]